MKQKLVIFDLDGTLADTAPDLLGTLNRIVARQGLQPIALDSVGQIVGHGAKAMISRAFELNETKLSETLLDNLFQSFLHDYSENIANETRLFDHVCEAMDELTHHGYELAICTNKTEKMARLLLGKLEVDHRFKAITGGDTFQFRKPDARHLIRTADLAGHEIRNAIMIGDSATDINAARNAEIPSVAVSFGYSDHPVEELGASALIHDYRDLVGVVESISEG